MFFTEVVHGIERIMRSRDYDVYISDSRGRADSEKRRINKFLERYVDGIVLIDPQTENMKNGFIEDVSKKIPVVCINGYHERIKTNFVLSDEEKGTKEALEHLISLGHKNIAFVRGESSYSYDIKENLYKEYMKNISIEPIVITVQDGNNIDVVENTMRVLIELSSKYQLGKEITAFFACNDLMAVGVLNGCYELNLKVPDDIAIIGFDNIILSQMTNPKLTTVDQNMRLLGERAAQKLLDLIEDKNLYSDTDVIETKLIIRKST